MSVIWKDGHFLDGNNAQLFHNDAGFSNGLAVFDSMLAENGILQDPREHFDRLIHDAGVVLGLSPSFLPLFEQMTQAWLPLLGENRLTKGAARIKTIVTGGVTDKPMTITDIPSVFITVAASGPAGNLPPVTCMVVDKHPRIAGSVLENCKRTDYTRAYASRQIAIAHGAEDAIITNTKGDVACGSTSNLFIQEQGVLVTPPLSEGVLAGITRAKILKERGGREEPISERRMRAADAVYLTNSFFGMRKAILRA